jgi:hypothetical protein
MLCCLDDEDSYFTALNMVAVYSLATVLPPTGLHPENFVVFHFTSFGISYIIANFSILFLV